MKIWITEIKAIDPQSGELKTWGGDNVIALSHEDAQQWCNDNKGYLKVIGELIAEIPCKDGSLEPDFKNMTEYDNLSPEEVMNNHTVEVLTEFSKDRQQ